MRVWRLRPGGEFERVRQSGRAYSHRLLVLIAQPRVNAPGAPSRIAVAAGRRLGTAVVRHRAKRLLREAIRRHYARIPAGVDVIVMARAPLLQADLEQIAAALAETLQHAQLWRTD